MQDARDSGSAETPYGKDRETIVKKECLTKPDGRYIIFYTFGEEAEEQEEEA